MMNRIENDCGPLTKWHQEALLSKKTCPNPKEDEVETDSGKIFILFSFVPVAS